MTVRRFFLNVHLVTGLVAALFLVLVGTTGSILAFQPDYDRWIHPSLWRVTPRFARPGEQDLVNRIERTLAADGPSARIERIEFGGDGVAQVFVLTNASRLFVNPYTGAVLGRRDRLTRLEDFVLAVRQLHIRLMAGNGGQWTVDIATAAVLLLIPTGLYLWWSRKRLRVSWKSSWRRITWDLHNTAGIYGCVFVLLLSLTGFFIAFEEPLLRVAGSKPWRPEALPHSAVPADAAATAPRPGVDQLLGAADVALPGAETYEVAMPLRPRSAVQVLKRGPGGAGHSTIYLDQYSGKVLRVEDFSTLPRAYRAHVINQAVHMGTIRGLPTRIAMSLSSLLLVFLVVTGTILWLKKVVT